MSKAKRCELRLRQLQCVACWPIEMYSSGPSNQLRHLSPSTQCVCVRACMIAFARCRRVCVCVCVHERALHEPLVCVRAVCVRACRVRSLTSVPERRRVVCVRDRRGCAFSIVRCLDVSCAFAVTSLVRAQLLCSIFAFKHIVRNHKAVVWITNHATLLHSAMMMASAPDAWYTT